MIIGLLVCGLCVALAIVAVRLTVQLKSLSKTIEKTERQVSERIQYIQVATVALGVIRQITGRVLSLHRSSPKEVGGVKKTK